MAGTMTVLERLGAAGVVPVVVLERADDAAALGSALAGGGLACAEVTLRTPAAVSAIERLADDPALLVGAGTVLEPAQVDVAVRAGARFIVSPGLDVAGVRRCPAPRVPGPPGGAAPARGGAAQGPGPPP